MTETWYFAELLSSFFLLNSKRNSNRSLKQWGLSITVSSCVILFRKKTLLLSYNKCNISLLKAAKTKCHGVHCLEWTKPNTSRLQITLKLNEKTFLRPKGKNIMCSIPVALLFNRCLATLQILSVLVMSKNIQLCDRLNGESSQLPGFERHCISLSLIVWLHTWLPSEPLWNSYRLRPSWTI